jgi:uncharacterized OB-fold protein
LAYAFEQVKIVGGIGADDEFWRGLEDGELRIQRCSQCAKWIWPAHFRCGNCGSWDLHWENIALRGRIFTWTRSHYAFGRVKERAEDVPYVSALIELPQADGARIMGIYDDARIAPRIDLDVIGSILPPAPKTKGYPSILWAPAHGQD